MENALVLPATSNMAAIDPDGVVLLAPRWLTAGLGLDHRFPPARGDSSLLRPLVTLARHLLREQPAVRDYCLEFVTPSGERLVALTDGFAVDDLRRVKGLSFEGAGVVLALRDVTEIVSQRRKTAAIGAFHGLIGQSLPMLEVYNRIRIYGPTDAPVVITGETGVGKELVARALHERSPRAGKAFVAVNCGALTSDLFESELFGHEKGSFTGAIRQHQGRFIRADGGSLFLDEIGEMPLMSQAKLLRALESGVVERVGAAKEERVDVRVIAATNIALEQAVQWRRFRADLYHRLSVLRVHVPPLRERKGDIPLLVEDFLSVFNSRYSRDVRRFSPEAMKILEEYYWPGNVRELRNVVERLVIEAAGEAISANALSQWMEEREYFNPGDWNADAADHRRASPLTMPPAAPFDSRGDSAFQDLPRAGDSLWGRRDHPRALPPGGWDWPVEVVEAPVYQAGDGVGKAATEEAPGGRTELTRGGIAEAYGRAGGNLTKAARLLGVHKATLYRHMKSLGISREDLNKEKMDK